MFVVLANVRFVLFLGIIALYYIVFWQVYMGLPLFVHDFVNRDAGVEGTISVEAFTVIACQVLLAVLTRKIPTFRTIAIGIFLTAVSWLILTLPLPPGEVTLHLGFATPTIYRVTLYVAAALFVLALGEILLSSRYYDYVSRLAPAGQEGLYMGFAFLPIGIGYKAGGWLGGYLLHEFGDVQHKPQHVWYAVTGIGVFATFLMWVYDKTLKPEKIAG